MNNTGTLKSRASLSFRAIAFTICVCFLVTDAAQAVPVIREPLPVNSESKKTQKTEANLLVSIPKTLGVVEESYSAPRSSTHNSPATIFYIQDAHDSLEAQENIAKIIKHLVKHNSVKTVFEEGYEGPVPTDQYFSGIQNPQVKKKVAHALMSQMLLGGAEYAHITRFDQGASRPVSTVRENELSALKPDNQGQDFRLIGADNVQLHLKNIEWYRQSAMTRKDTDADLRDLTARLQALAKRELPKEIKVWMKLRKRFDGGELDLVEYLKRLWRLRGAGPDLPQDALRLSLPLSDEKGGEGAASDGGLFSRHKSSEKKNTPQEEKTRRGYVNIFTVLQAEQARTPESLKAVQSMAHHELFNEIDRFENEFAEQMLQNSKQRAIFNYGKTLNQLLRLSALEISFEEYEAIGSALQTFKTEELITFIANETQRSLALSKKWEENIRHATRFYELAEERDNAVEQTLQQYKNDLKVTAHYPPAALVFGGFHKENIKRILVRNGFSFVVISPKISERNAKHQALYRNLMSGGVPGETLPAMVRIATRYAPIFEIGEYLGQRERVMALINTEARRAGEARSEVRAARDLPQLEEDFPLFRFPTRRVERAMLKFQSDFPNGVLEKARELMGEIRGQALTLETLKQKLPDPLGAAQKRIVFTGAPYAGKTTFMTAMNERYAGEAVVIPEVIHILKEAGFDLNTTRGQRIVYALKYLLEQAAARVYPERIVFLDRGTLDGAAYWPEGREAFLRELGGQRGELERYGAVIQMQSVATAEHAVKEYRDRVESKDRAAEIERDLEAVWRNHGRYYRVPHSEWGEKTRQAEAIIDFVKSRLVAGMKAPLVFDFEHEGQHYHYPNIAAYDFDPKTLGSFLSRKDETGVQAPLVMDLHFKAPCGLRCVFCYTEGGVTDERHAIDEEKFGTMEPEDIREAIRQYAALGGHTLILLSIGEPLTDVNRFIEYAQLAQELGVRVVTFTNMLLITPEVAERLRKAEVNMLLKLNHLDPAINNQLAGRAKPYKYVEYRGQKIPQQLVNVLEAYRDRPDLLAISSDITRINSDNILEISRWAYEALGVAHFRKHLYYFGFAQANRDLLVLSDEEALAFDKKLYEFDRQYGYQYPAPEKFSDQYSFDMRRFLNNNVNVSGFPVRTFAHYLSGIYHSSEVVQPKYGYKKGVRIALKNNATGKVDGEGFFRQIFRHILFFKGVSARLKGVEDSFQADRAQRLDHRQTQASRQQRWDKAYRLTVDIKKYLAENGEDLAVPDRRRLLKILKRATELARENVLYWIPKNPGMTVIANDQLRTAYPAGEKFQFFSLEGESAFYTDPYQVTYSEIPPGHEQVIHGHFSTRELSVALSPGLRFHFFKIQNGEVVYRVVYDVPEFSGAAFGIRTPHSLLNPTEQPIRNMTVKYGAQVTDRWDLKEAPEENTFTFEGGVTAPQIEKAGSAARYSFDKGDLHQRIVVLQPGEVYPYELAAGAGKGWFIVEGAAKVSAPLLEAHDVSAKTGSIVYVKGSDKPGMVLFSNESAERLVMAGVDLKKSLAGRFQSAISKTYQALITDVDGVLTDPGSGKVSEEALKFLTQIIQQGVPVLLISGRNETAFGQGYRKQAPSLEEVAVQLRKLLAAAGHEEALEHLFLSSENGAVISNGFNREDPRRVNYPTGFETQTLTILEQTSLIDGLKALGLVDEHVRVENKTHGFVLKDSFGTRVAGIALELEKELKTRGLWDSFEIFSSHDEGAVHVYPRGSNKRGGLEFMIRFFGLNPLEVAVFADRGGLGEQDHALLEGAAGFSTDTVAEEGKTINLRALSGYLPGYQSFMWAAEQLKFSNQALSFKVRSEVRAMNSKGPRRIRMLTPERAEKINAWFEDRFDLFKKVNGTGEKAGSYRAVVRLESGADFLRSGQPRIEDERWVLPIIYNPKIDIPLSEALRFIAPIMESLVRAEAQDRAKIRWQQLSFSLEHPKSFKQIQQLERRFLQAPDKITWDDLGRYVSRAPAITKINTTSEAMTLPKFPGVHFFPRIYKVRGDQLSLRIITYDADTSQIHAVAIHAFDVYHSQQKGSGWRMEDSVEEMLLAQRLQNLLEKKAKKETGAWVIENRVRRAEVQDLSSIERQAVLDSIEDIHHNTGLDLEGLTKDLRSEFSRVYPAKQKLFMITRAGVDVGYALVSSQRDRRRAAIYALYVRKEWARKGILELLFDQILNDLKQQEVQTVSWLINLDEQELLNLTDQRIQAGQLSLTSAAIEVGQQKKYTRVTKKKDQTLSEFLKRVQEVHGDKAGWDQDYKPGVEAEWTLLNSGDSPAGRSEVRAADKYFYSPSLRAYVERVPLKIDAQAVRAAEKLGIKLKWNDEGFIVELSQSEGLLLLKALGAAALSPSDYWKVFNDAQTAGDTAMIQSLTDSRFAEWLDVYFVEEEGKIYGIEHPQISYDATGKPHYSGIKKEILVPVGRPGWFVPSDGIDTHGFPLKTTKNFNGLEGVWKYWDVHTEFLKTGLAGIRGYVTSSGTPSLDLGIPPTAHFNVLMLRAVRQTLPQQATWQDTLKNLEPLFQAYQALPGTLDAYERFYDKQTVYLFSLPDTYLAQLREVFRAPEETILYTARERLVDILGLLQLISQKAGTQLDSERLTQFAEAVLGIQSSRADEADFKNYIQNSRERLRTALMQKRPIQFVMGHKNPDTDAIISAMGEAYRSQQMNPDIAVIPVAQTRRIPDEVQRLLGDELSRGLLLTEDDLYRQATESGQAKWTLVDHNVAPEVQRFVTAIFDHHTVSEVAQKQEAAKTLEMSGSTTALIFQKMAGIGMKPDAGVARILYGATLMDTENRLASKMTDKDVLIMDVLKNSSAVKNDDFFYQVLMNSLLRTADAEYLFERDYKEDWGFGFAVAKGKGFFDEGGNVIKPELLNRMFSLANEKNKAKNLPLTLVKVVDYAEDNEKVNRERMYFVFNEGASKEFRRAIYDVFEGVLDTVFYGEPGFQRKAKEELNYVEYWGTGKQLSRKKTAPELEPVVKAFNQYFYSASTGLYVSREFLKNDLRVQTTAASLNLELSTDAQGQVNRIPFYDAARLLAALHLDALSLPEYWQVLKDAENKRDAEMLASLKSPGFVEFLNTLIVRSGEKYQVIHHPIVTMGAKGGYSYTGTRLDVQIKEGVPGLIHPSEIDSQSGFPAVVRSPMEDISNPELWRYWSPDADLTIPTRGYIFLLGQPALDLKIHPEDALPNLGIRTVVRNVRSPVVTVKKKGKKLQVLIHNDAEGDPAARSEMREQSRQPQNPILTEKNIRELTTPAAVFLNAGELARLRPSEADSRMDELLALLSQSKGIDIYLDAADRYPIESIKNKKFQQMLEEYSERFHVGMFDRARLAQKKIVIQAALWGSDESAAATAEKITQLKQNYKISGDVLPLEYTKPGALKVFLDLAELGTEAELIRKISDDYAVRGQNGRWQISETYLSGVWEAFAAHTAVAWAA